MTNVSLCYRPIASAALRAPTALTNLWANLSASGGSSEGVRYAAGILLFMCFAVTFYVAYQVFALLSYVLTVCVWWYLALETAGVAAEASETLAEVRWDGNGLA